MHQLTASQRALYRETSSFGHYKLLWGSAPEVGNWCGSWDPLLGTPRLACSVVWSSHKRHGCPCVSVSVGVLPITS